MSLYKLVPTDVSGSSDFAVSLMKKRFGDLLDLSAEGNMMEDDFIFLGTAKDPHAPWLVRKLPTDPQGYAIYVGPNFFCEGKQAVIIVGRTEAGMLNGVVDFLGEYCGSVLHSECGSASILQWEHFDTAEQSALAGELIPWEKRGVPRIKNRALWSWGHVIYDYRSFFDNMALLRFNKAVIWNDYLPLNEKEIIDYAHSRGISVFWGFAWGWDTNCKLLLGDPDFVASLKDNIVRKYENEYLQSAADGIYFQSFTEMSEQEVGGVSVAEAVTQLVNETSAELLERYPDLKIQFGLHATSVNTRLETIARVDPRVRIVWEDCGAFPYAYDPAVCEDFEETSKLTDRLLTLRGDKELFGAVLKGMITLDWTHFKHQTGRYVMGEEAEEIIQKRLAAADKIVKYYGSEWLTHADLFDRFISQMEGSKADPELQVLFEDGVLERRIPEALAVYAALLWEHPEDAASLKELIKTVRRCPFVS